MELIFFGALADQGIRVPNLQGEFRGRELTRVRPPEAHMEWTRRPKESAFQFEERIVAELRGYSHEHAG